MEENLFIYFVIAGILSYNLLVIIDAEIPESQAENDTLVFKRIFKIICFRYLKRYSLRSYSVYQFRDLNEPSCRGLKTQRGGHTFR